MSYYAIGFNDWVEIRKTGLKLKRTVGSVTKKIREKKFKRVDPTTLNNIYEDGDTTYTIKNISYIGGKVVGLMKSDKFRELVGATLPKDGVTKLTSDLVSTLRSKKILKWDSN